MKASSMNVVMPKGQWLALGQKVRRQAALPGSKMAVLNFVPLGKGDAAHFAAGGAGGTHPGANAPHLPGGDFRESSRLLAGSSYV
jgi:hypothetical protein